MTAPCPVGGTRPAALARTAPPRHRATWAQVDLGRIRANVRALRRTVTSRSLMAVVKADAYGHGLIPAARAALEGGADWLGVALVEEGEALRQAGIEAPVLVLSEPPLAAVRAIVRTGLTPTLYSSQFLAALEDEGRHRGRPIPVHVKLDTGLGRVGPAERDWEDMFRLLRRARMVVVDGVWSHFAVADRPGHPFTDRQAATFERGVALARAAGLRPRFVHLCNSAATQLLPDLHHDMVRTGLSVYGLRPVPGVAPGAEVRPALAWFAHLTFVKAVRAGTSVSYGLRWSAPVDTVVATIGVGYADGLRRDLSRVGQAVWNGRRVPLAGTVCMDQALVDLGPAAAAAPGDELVLLGGDGQLGITAEDWARWLDTISYEVVCGIGARVPRVYVDAADRGIDVGVPT